MSGETLQEPVWIGPVPAFSDKVNVPASASRAAPAGQLSKAGTRGMTSCRESSGASRLVIIGRDVVWYLPDGKAYSPSGSVRMPFDSGLQAFCASRGLIEFLIRRRTTAIPNIRFESGCTVRGLLCRDGMCAGSAAPTRDRSGRTWWSMRPGAGIVRANGLRRSEFVPPRKPRSASTPPTAPLPSAAPRARLRAGRVHHRPGAAIHPARLRDCDRERHLAGQPDRAVRRFSSTDAQGFRAFARELHSDLACRIIESAGQLSPIVHHRFVSSVQRHYERLHALPEGFLAVGDALCTFNPIYAQGMSAAARQAAILREILSEQAERSAGTRGIAVVYLHGRPNSTARRGTSRPPSTSRFPRPAAPGRRERRNGRATSRRWTGCSRKTRKSVN